MMRRPLFVANWKMHKTIAETRAFVEQMKQVSLPSDREVVICAPCTALTVMQELLAGYESIHYGAQNMHWEERGAYTGEISAPMLVELGCRYVIIGHSERRRDHGETDATVNKKIHTALRFGLTPILCVGETLEQRRQNKTESIVQQQIEQALAGIQPADLATIVIAYEPIWAIGTGEAATAEQAQTVQAFIRILATKHTRILYGGSVSAENIHTFMVQPDIDGALVGGASLDPEQFAQLVGNAV